MREFMCVNFCVHVAVEISGALFTFSIYPVKQKNCRFHLSQTNNYIQPVLSLAADKCPFSCTAH